MDTSLHPTPTWPAVLREQIRSVALHTRRETIVLALLLAGTLALSLVMAAFGGGGDADLVPMTVFPVIFLGFIAPMAVWKGEGPSRRSYLWAMPVDRARNTLAKVLGGWVWLMAAVVAYLLCALILTLATGGDIGVQEMRVTLFGRTPGGQPAPGEAHVLRWSVPLWQWLTPFAGTTITYLLGSIVALSSDRPWRWFAGLLFAAFLVVASRDEVYSSDPLLSRVVNGPVGIAPAIAGSESHPQTFTAPSGRTLEISRGRPSFGAWAVAMPFWVLLGMAGVWLAARRRPGGQT